MSRRVVLWDNDQDEEVADLSTRNVLADYPDDIDDDEGMGDSDDSKQLRATKVTSNTVFGRAKLLLKKAKALPVRRITRTKSIFPRSRMVTRKKKLNEAYSDEEEEEFEDEPKYIDEEECVEDGVVVRYVYVEKPEKRLGGMRSKIGGASLSISHRPVRNGRIQRNRQRPVITLPTPSIKKRITFLGRKQMLPWKNGKRFPGDFSRDRGSNYGYQKRNIDGNWKKQTLFNEWEQPARLPARAGRRALDQDLRLRPVPEVARFEPYSLSCKCNEKVHTHKGRGFQLGGMRAFD